MTDTTLTFIGNLADDPTLRFTPTGAAVANFRILSTPRTFDKQANDWKDGETLALNCNIWREAAENVAESLQKGMRVVAQGRLKSRSYDTKEGEKRTVIELEVEEIGPSLRWASAKVTRTQRGDRNTQQSAPSQQGQGWGGQQAAPAEDPWGAPAEGSSNSSWGSSNQADPPF